MTPEKIALVKATWQKLLPQAQVTGEIFYDRLCELDPDIIQLNAHEHVDQLRTLMRSIGSVIDNLESPSSVIPHIDSLGDQQVGYGVLKKDYDTAATALFWTLENGLGDQFTAADRIAWEEAFEYLASLMNHNSKQRFN